MSQLNGATPVQPQMGQQRQQSQRSLPQQMAPAPPINAPVVGPGPSGYGGAAPYASLPSGPANPMARQPGTPGGPVMPQGVSGGRSIQQPQTSWAGENSWSDQNAQNALRNMYGS